MVEEFGGPDVYKSRLRPKARPLVAAPQSSWLPIGFMSGSSAPPAVATGAETVRHASPVHLRNADRDVRRLSGGEPAPGAGLGTLRVRIDSAWHLLPKDRNGKSDPYVLLRLTSSTEYYQTKAKMRTLSSPNSSSSSIPDMRSTASRSATDVNSSSPSSPWNSSMI